MNILFVTNVLTPYRMFFYNEINKKLKVQNGNLKVLVMMKPDHNKYWNYDDYKTDYTELLSCHYIGKYAGEFFINTGISKAIDSFKPDTIVLCSSYWYPTLLWISAKYKGKAKIFYWSESNKIKIDTAGSIKKKVRERLRKYTYKKYDGFLYPGKLAEDLIRDYNSNPEFMFQLPNLIDEKKFYYNSENSFNKAKNKLALNLPIDKKIFFCPARLSPEKGILEFLDGISDSELKLNSVFVIAGMGELKDKILEKANRENIDLILTGYIEQNKMIEYYRAIDFLLLPSLSDPSPLCCIEALWSAVPLLISDRVGNRDEVLIEGKNGFSFDPEENNVELFNRIAMLDESWIYQAGICSLSLAQKNFSSEDIINNLIEKLELVGY